MKSARLTDDEIVRGATVVEAPDANLSRMWGTSLHIVKWTNGLTALVGVDPSDRTKWKRLLVKMYRAGCSGWRGPVSIGR